MVNNYYFFNQKYMLFTFLERLETEKATTPESGGFHHIHIHT